MLSREPGIVSEPLAIEIPDLFQNRVLGVRVAESRLVVEVPVAVDSGDGL